MRSYRNSDPHPPIMQGSPPPAEWRVSLDNWDSPPFNRWSFQNVAHVHHTVPVRRGRGHSARLNSALRDLDGLAIPNAPADAATIAAMLDVTYTDGIVALHQGDVVYERYFNAMTASSLHLSQSVAKSIVATTFGILVDNGLIDPQQTVETYIPEFAACGYAGAKLQHVLHMRSGVDFNEDYTATDSHMAQLDVAAGWRPARLVADPACIYDLILTLKQDRPHGAPFLYRSIETDVLALTMERVTGRKLADIVSTELWGPMGAESDALFTVDSAGQALADGGFAATLRDYARFGQMHLQRGQFHGKQIVSADWVDATRNGDPTVFESVTKKDLPNAAYSNQFWIEDVHTGAYMCLGVFGQTIYIDPAHDMVIAKFSTWPDFLDNDLFMQTLRGFHAIANELTAGA